MKLLSREELVTTSGVDHADWNYHPLMAYVMRRRFALVCTLLPTSRISRMLEIGFGSGVFVPELSERCDELYGVDIHPHVEEVQDVLGRRGLHPQLQRGDAVDLHFAESFFDALVSVSALEFVSDIAGAARECARVLKPHGVLAAVMPVRSPVLDAALSAVTHVNPHADYGDRRERVLPALLGHFRVVRKAGFLGIYKAYALQRRLD